MLINLGAGLTSRAFFTPRILGMTSEFLQLAKKRAVRKTEPLEVDIEETFVKYAASLGVLTLKLQVVGRRGFPDRTVIGKGFIFVIEFKRSKNYELSPQQELYRKELVSRGIDYFVCRKIGEAESILNRYMESPL